MRFTENYRLGSFEAGEVPSALEDSRRFLTIDRQLLGLFQIFGNGVIEGWNLSQSGGLTVTVSSGRGNVRFMSAQTVDPKVVSGLTPNVTNYIYAQAVELTRFNRDVFFFSDIALLSSGQIILLGSVVTNETGVVSIDESLRNDIGFIETIKQLINQHRHRGGTDSPTKVDLSSEVMGKLPGFRVGDFDASKVTSGRLAAGRLPTIEHGSLLHSGVLTHAQLDSFVRNLSNPNVRLLGELSAINMLQLYMAYKHQWNEVDSFATNLLVMVPGITQDSFTDYVATTAVVDRFNHTIMGIPSVAGSLLTTTFSTEQDYLGARIRVNLEPKKTPAGVDYLRLTRPASSLIVEGFDNVFSQGAEFPQWKLETVSSNDNTEFVSDSSAKVDGAFSAKLDLDQSFRVQATRLFDSTQDWTGYNQLDLSVASLSGTHGQMRFQILGPLDSNNVPTVIDDFAVLEAGELTVGFKNVIRDLLPITRDKVLGIRLYTDTALGWDITQPSDINIDQIRISNTLFFDGSGSIRFRVSTPQPSKWAAITWDADLNGGQVLARARSGPNFGVFDQGTLVPFLAASDQNGFDPGVSDNVAFEVEMQVVSNTGKTASPALRSITISYVTPSESSGLTLDSTSDFMRASKLSNVRVESPGQVLIDGRIDAGDYLWGNASSVQQADRFGTPVLGLTGSDLPISPLQASQLQLLFRQPGLSGVAHVRRLDDRTYLVTDTFNDRVVLFDQNGNVLRMVASNNARNNKELFPLGAAYNSESDVLYVTWSTNVSLKNVDLTKFTISGTGIVFSLSNTLDTVVAPAGQKSALTEGNVIPIKLGDTHAGELETYLANAGVTDQRIFLNVEPGAVKEVVNTDSLNFATIAGPRGLPIFIGPVTFTNALFRPISASITSDGNWLISNAKPLMTQDGADPVTGVGREEITSVVEVVPETGEVVFSDNSVDFSILTLGAAIEVNSRYMAVAGISTDDAPPVTTSEESETTQTLGGGTVLGSSSSTTSDSTASDSTTSTDTPTTGESSTGSSSKSDFDELGKYRGRVKIVEKSSGRVVYDQPTSDGTYAADVQSDQDGNLTVVEKAFDEQVGRGRVVKIDEDGNVFFQYGTGEFSSFNDVRVLSTGNMVVSS
jgi:hypothetical protein